MKKLHVFFSSAILLVGIIHTVGTFFFYEALNHRALWFAGAGLGGIFIAALNLHFNRGSIRGKKFLLLYNTLFWVWLLTGTILKPGPFEITLLTLGSGMFISSYFGLDP